MTNSPQAKPVYRESTYQMLVASEEKERTVIEDIVYLLLVIATSTAIWQFTQQPMPVVEFGPAQAQAVAALPS